jgi:cell wall-associated NlpC family hydrolase
VADTSGGINGIAVAITTAGAVLVYAGLRGVSPLQAIRDASSGKPPAVIGKPTTDPDTGGTVAGGIIGAANDIRRSMVVSAAQKYRGDIYSQLKRTQPGYSDCSSFVDKALKDAGINPPSSPWANTALFRLSPEWKTIPASQVQPGDIAISAAHMVLVTAPGGASGIGQQRPNVNVRTGTMRELFGSQSYVFKTWTGYPGSSTPDTGGGGGGGGGGSW